MCLKQELTSRINCSLAMVLGRRSRVEIILKSVAQTSGDTSTKRYGYAAAFCFITATFSIGIYQTTSTWYPCAPSSQAVFLP